MYCNRRRPDSGLPKKNNHSISGVVLKLEGFRGQGWKNRLPIPPSDTKVKRFPQKANGGTFNPLLADVHFTLRKNVDLPLPKGKMMHVPKAKWVGRKQMIKRT